MHIARFAHEDDIEAFRRGGYNGKRDLALAAGNSLAYHYYPLAALALIMVAQYHREVDSTLYPAGISAESSESAICWSAIIAGTVAAIAVTITLLTLGAAFGLATLSPWPGVGAKPTTFTIGAGIWLLVMQWMSLTIGGYLAGRLRTRWTGLHTDEVFFRDTAHGFMVWATSTVIIAIVAVSATVFANLAGSTVDVTSTVSSSKEAIDEARKVAATFSGFTGLALFVGAFIGAVSGAIGGRIRDLHP